MERLQKVLAQAGVASRRASEALIRDGRVTVNGHVVTELGTKVDPLKDKIRVDGTEVGRSEPAEYVMLYKPRGVISSASDSYGRKTVVDLVPSSKRLYPVGRLDQDSEGLILLTNDGTWAQSISHPKFEVEREYRVLVEGPVDQTSVSRLRHGVEIEGELMKPDLVTLLPSRDDEQWVKIVLHQGRKREIRRMMGAVGHPVARLVRVRIGSLLLGDLQPGRYRSLSATEISSFLRKSANRREDRSSEHPSRRRGSDHSH